MPITQEDRLLSLATPLAADFLLIKRLRCREGLSQLFRIDLEILHEEDSEGTVPTLVDPASVLGQPMHVTVRQAGEELRYFHGICVDFTQGNRNGRFSKYRAEIVPRLWLLTQRSQSRIYQQKSVPDIIKDVFTGFEVRYELQGNFEPRNYCVQYRETDWDFASRLMEEEGIYYYFEHTADTHRMIVANTPQSHRACPGRSEIPFEVDTSRLGFDEVGKIRSWRVENRLRTGKVTLWDHNFELPTSKLDASQSSLFNIGGNENLEIYDFPGEYAKRFDGVDRSGGVDSASLQKVFEDRSRTARIRQQEIDVAHKIVHATSDCAAITSGYRFTLSTHPNGENNIDHVLVNVETEAVQSPSYNSEENIGNAYVVKLVCIPHGSPHAPFRPLRKTPKPVVQGSQTAFVVGPAGEEIFTDKYGRVKVQFHWDRYGQSDGNSSCWIRVGTLWAGKQWGTVFTPRIGQEVIVDFLEGDPDQPIIVGAVYNPQTMPPYTLPDEKTKSTIKSMSSKGGGGFNEFRFEDKKGSEQIFIHAEKNQDIRVKNDCMELIKRDRHLLVERDQLEKIKRDKHLQVVGDHNEKIGGTMSINIGADLQEKVTSNYALDAGSAVHIKGGGTVVVEAGTSLTLKVGGNFININPGGIFIKGTMVMLNSGGAAGSGAGCSPEAPKDPLEADNADPGQLPPAPQRNRPPPVVSYSPMATLMRNAARSGVPFCDI